MLKTVLLVNFCAADVISENVYLKGNVFIGFLLQIELLDFKIKNDTHFLPLFDFDICIVSTSLL